MKEKRKYDIGEILEVKTAQMMYEYLRISFTVTDGKYVQIGKEPTTDQAK